MKFKLLFLYSFSLPLQLFSQALDAQFDLYLYDFGFIKEAEGKVSHNFILKNNEKTSIEINQITTSCGCMASYVSKKIIPGGDSAVVQLSYDPEGRPGKFIKSAEIRILGSSDRKQLYFINLKGVVIEKEILPAYVDNWDFAELKIKPFSTPLVSSSDYRFFNQVALQDFINDITYEIDLNNFATIKLELALQNNDNSEAFAESIFTPLKKLIITELKRRNYSENQIGFDDYPNAKTNHSFDKVVAWLKISSLYLNDDVIKSSGFYANAEKSLAYLKAREIDRAKSDSVLTQKLLGKIYLQNNYSKLNTKNSDYEKFINQSARQVLMNGHVNVFLKIKTFGKSEKDEKKLLDYALKIQTQVAKDLNEQGIDKSKISFAVPSFHSVSDQKKEGLLLSSLNTQADMNKYTFMDVWQNTVDTLALLNYKHNTKIPQDLPGYFTFYSKGQIDFDVKSREFQIWRKSIIDVINSGKKVAFLIESSESNSVNINKENNLFIARKRSERAQEALQSQLNLLGINETQYNMLPAIYATKGLAFDSREFGISFNEKHQYLKIIALYDSTFNLKEELIPYQVNFKYNYFETPVQSEIFQVFVNRLIPVIANQGYIKLKLESSSSRVPAENFSSNYALSYQRIVNIKEKLFEEVLKRGYDPKRIIITEERALVQGPVFLRNDNKNDPTFHPYQYIKVIPESLLQH